MFSKMPKAVINGIGVGIEYWLTPCIEKAFEPE
jgi:hypothetical protein